MTTMNISSVNSYTQVTQLQNLPANQNQSASNFEIQDEVQISEQAQLLSNEEAPTTPRSDIGIRPPVEPPI
jgi:hypothetical protein